MESWGAESPGAESFRIDIPQAELDELRARLRATRWPDRETEPGWAQGVPLDWMRELAAYWADGYDWRAREARLNAVPQLRMPVGVGEGDGTGSLRIHAAHLRSPHPGAVPLVLTHGWPGSFAEFLAVAGPLVDPPAHGGDAVDAVHLVLPSLPGYAFSDAPAEPGWGVERIADAWVELMRSLGYPRFVAGGSDWGTSVSASIGQRHPERVLGLVLVPPLVAPDPATLDAPTDFEREALAALEARDADGGAYSAVHATRPQTIGYALADSPVGLAAWIAEKHWAWRDHGAGTVAIDRDELLDTVMLYWLTGSATSSARLYRESIAGVSALFTDAQPVPIDVPVGAIVFPAEVPRVSRRWAERRFPDIRAWTEPDRGGHFGAQEHPAAFVEGIRAMLRALRG